MNHTHHKPSVTSISIVQSGLVGPIARFGSVNVKRLLHQEAPDGSSCVDFQRRIPNGQESYRSHAIVDCGIEPIAFIQQTRFLTHVGSDVESRVGGEGILCGIIRVH